MSDRATTVLIVTYNSRRWFKELAAALASQTAPARILVWDNASQDEEKPSQADFPGAEITLSPRNIGFAAANNRLAERVDTPFIALLNPDAFPAPTWLAELLAAAARHPWAASFGSTQIDAADPERADGLGDAYHVVGAPWRGGHGRRFRRPPAEAETFSACAAAALYRTAAWREVGGFDESFFSYGEDVDLGFRLRLSGYGCVQASAAVVRHVGGGSAARRSAFAVYHGRRNRLWTFVKNMPPPLFWAMLVPHLALQAATLAGAVGRSTWAPSVQALRDGVRGLGPALKSRASIQRARRAPLPALLRALAWSPVSLVTRAPVLRPIKRPSPPL